MKGMALETIGFITIALVGVIVLIMFISGSLGDLARNVFCYFYQKIFSENIDMCETSDTIPEQIVVRPGSSEDLARYIAAYSIMCWEDSTKSLKTIDTNCYSLTLEGGPFYPPVDEEAVTDILMDEGGCNRLGNSDIDDDCGNNNQLLWDVEGDTITDQQLILIKYDDSSKQIVVRSGLGISVTTTASGPYATIVGTVTTTIGVTTTATVNPMACLSDSPCSSGWPDHQGELREYNEEVYACDVFEVCDPGLQAIADEAMDCCQNGCSGSCHVYCDKARNDAGITGTPTQNQVKKCSAFYLALGLGPTATIMEDYYWPEIVCENLDNPSVDCGYADSSYDGIPHNYNSYTQNLLCRSCVGEPCGWSSDTDMTENSCYLSDLPAHVSANIINTGICVDYSIVLTTLLRMSGYDKDEVYTVIGADGPSDCGVSPDCSARPECCNGHSWNIVKLPGETKWSVIDTTGNVGTPYTISGLPGTSYDYCSALGIFNGIQLGSDGCTNDADKIVCPGEGETYGC